MSAREEWLDAVDKLAASEVMKWRDHPVIPRLWWIHPPTPGVRKSDWSPTRSISDAWKLVEAMEWRGFGLTLYTPGAYTDEGLGPCEKHTAVFMSEYDAGEHTCDSTPLAITLASLHAVGCEIPEEPTRE